jgi:hypothetical protein
MNHMKPVILTGLLVTFLVGGYANSEEAKLAPFHLKVKTHHTLNSVLNVHGSPSIGLVVNGKEFSNIVGPAPYYLPIPQWGSIFFVTESNKDGSFQYHIVNVTNNMDVTVDGAGSRFGNWMGATNKYFRDYITVLSTNSLKLTSATRCRTGPATISYILDANARRLVSKEVQEFDKGGKMVKSKVTSVDLK